MELSGPCCHFAHFYFSSGSGTYATAKKHMNQGACQATEQGLICWKCLRLF